MSVNMDPLGELRFIYKVGGLWYYFSEGNVFQVILQILHQAILNFALFLNIYCIYRDGFKESMGGTMIYLPPAIVVNVCHYALFFRQTEIKSLLETLEPVMSKNKEEREIFKNDYLFAVKIGKICRYTLFLIWIFFFTTPQIMELIFYLVGFNEFPIYVPSIINYIFMEKGRLQTCVCGLFGTLWTACAMHSHYGFTISNITLLIYYHIELKIFRYKIENQYAQSLLSDQMHTVFKDIISIQQELLRTHQALKNVVALALGLQNTIIALCICYFLYTTTATESTYVKLLCTYAFMLYLTDASISCYAGELIESEGHAIFETLYGLPWYELQAKDRRALKLILLQAKRTMKIEYKGTAATNLESLLQIIQASYSYFMLLKSI